MSKEKVVMIHERIPSLKDQRKQRANRRLLFFLSFFFLLLLLMIYFQSPLSNVKTIIVTGNQFVDDSEIIELSQMNDNTSMWNIDKQGIINKILNHSEIKNVSFRRKFPSTVEFIVQEYTRIGYLFREDRYYPILETGQYLKELPRQQYPSDAPLLIDFKEGDALSELSAELRSIPSYLIERISEITFAPTDNDPLRIILYMTDGIEVHTSINDFGEKLAPYPSIVRELDPNKKGILHMRMSPYFEEFIIEEEENSEGEW
ncbi:FtsQ-type POTRA domain-containing protein [bacterium LRH843]|nr:FtsQ-type POTRA domain-containing protein [bacterium LRH843]